MPFFAKFGGGNSNKFGFTRGASVPLTQPTSLSATVSNTSASISFTAPTNTGGLPLTNYEYSFNNSSWTALSPSDAISPVTIPSLTQNTAYTVYLRAVNSIGAGPASTGVSFTTEGVPTSAPSGLSSIQTDTSVAISFTAAASSTAITNYEYSFNNSTWTALSPVDSTSPITISGLSQNTAYSIYLRGVNSYGSGPGSTATSFTTFGPPTGTTTISSVSVGVTTATVNFSTTAGGSAITGYDYYLHPVLGWTDAGVSSSPKSLSGLTENTAYVVYMRPKNAYGIGPQSAGYSFTTALGPIPVNFYVLAGGGGGGGGYANGTTGVYWSGGGGGAGGLRTSVTQNGGGAGLDSAISFSSGASATVTVGGGGAGAVNTNTGGAGSGGGSSVFHTITAGGGGAGNAYIGGNAGSYGYNGRSVSNGVGGSGGGVGGSPTTVIDTRYWGTAYYAGAGLANSITGSSISRGGGGGNGGVYNVNGGQNGSPAPGTSGSGGGGDWTNRPGYSASANYGGGGGGGIFYDYAGYGGGSGGSGIVTISYPTTYGTLTSISGLAYTYSVNGSFRVYQFTSGSGTIVFPTF